MDDADCKAVFPQRRKGRICQRDLLCAFAPSREKNRQKVRDTVSNANATVGPLRHNPRDIIFLYHAADDPDCSQTVHRPALGQS